MKIRPSDVVSHIPTGEDWVVCGVNYDREELIPCGYPFPSIAKIDDCVLKESCGLEQTTDMIDALRQCGLYSFIEQRGGKKQ